MKLSASIFVQPVAALEMQLGSRFSVSVPLAQTEWNSMGDS
jgi:hypothetical protein